MKRSASYQYISTMVHCREVKDECWIPIECNASAWKKLIDCGQGRSCWSGNGSKQMMTKAEAMGEWRTVYILWHRRRVNDTQFPGISVFMFCSGAEPFQMSWIFLSSKTTQNKLRTVYVESRSIIPYGVPMLIGCVIYQSIRDIVHDCMDVLFFSPCYDIWELGNQQTGIHGHDWLERRLLILPWFWYHIGILRQC